MTDGTNITKEPTKIHIGKLIEAAIRDQGRAPAWLAAKLCCDRSNIYNIMRRESVDTQLLQKLSLLLDIDFFKYYSDYIKECKETGETEE